MYKVIITHLAKQDIKGAANWYNSKQQGLGNRFTTVIREKVDFLKREPLAVATRYDEIKTAVIDTFPFMIHYAIHKAENSIVILAVLHTSRNPSIWKEVR